MSNIVNIQVSEETVIFAEHHRKFVYEIDNVVFFESQTMKMRSIGLDERNGDGDDIVNCCPIFDFQYFQPELAGLTLWEWRNEMVSLGLLRREKYLSSMELELNIVFKKYEEIPLYLQKEFEYLIFRFLSVKKLTVNGTRIQWEPQNVFPAWLFLGMNTVLTVGFSLFSIFPVSFFIGRLSEVVMPTFIYLVIAGLLIFSGFFLFSKLGMWLSVFLWFQIMKKFFSKGILEYTLMYQTSPRKNKLGGIESYLLNAY